MEKQHASGTPVLSLCMVVVTGVAAVWGNILIVSSLKGLHFIDTRKGVPQPYRLFIELTLAGGISSSPVVVSHDNTAPEEEHHGPVVYVTAHDQHVYKFLIQGTCNGMLSEPCKEMSASMLWRKLIDFTDESEPYYSFQDDRCTAPFMISRTANLECVMCKRQLPCSRSCSDCEDQTVGGYNPLRSSAVLYGDMLYVMAWDGVHALSRASGERRWHHFIRLTSKVEQDERFYVGTSYHRARLMMLSCVVVADLVICPSAFNLVCLNRNDGSLKWRVEHPRSYDYISTPVVYHFQESTREVMDLRRTLLQELTCTTALVPVPVVDAQTYKRRPMLFSFHQWMGACIASTYKRALCYGPTARDMKM